MMDRALRTSCETSLRCLYAARYVQRCILLFLVLTIHNSFGYCSDLGCSLLYSFLLSLLLFCSRHCRDMSHQQTAQLHADPKAIPVLNHASRSTTLQQRVVLRANSDALEIFKEARDFLRWSCTAVGEPGSVVQGYMLLYAMNDGCPYAFNRFAQRFRHAGMNRIYFTPSMRVAIIPDHVFLTTVVADVYGIDGERGNLDTVFGV